MIQTAKPLLKASALALAMFVLSLATPAAAQDWPTAPIRIIVPFPAGGSADVTIQPLVDGVTHPTIELRPFRVPDAPVHAEKVEQVWLVEGPLPSGIGASAVGRFGPEGLSLTIDNRLNGTTEPPEVEALYQKYKIQGLPTVIFIDSNGKVREDLTITGFMKPAEFVDRMKKVQ